MVSTCTKCSGRLLVAQTMLLSRLWHYTTHLNITTETIRQWQSRLIDFCLVGKTEKSNAFTGSAKRFISMSTEWWTTSSFLGGMTKVTTHSSPTALWILWTKDYYCELNIYLNEIITSYPSFLEPHKPIDVLTIAPHWHVNDKAHLLDENTHLRCGIR